MGLVDPQCTVWMVVQHIAGPDTVPSHISVPLECMCSRTPGAIHVGKNGSIAPAVGPLIPLYSDVSLVHRWAVLVPSKVLVRGVVSSR